MAPQKHEPLVSIVVPTYNQGPYIEQCLRSIAEQNYPDIEVVIQDSLSTDNTEKICRAFVKNHPRFYYYREKDKGQSDALNRGLFRSHGDYWTWICSDDFFVDKTAIKRLIDKFRVRYACNKLCVGIYGEAAYFDDDGKEIAPYYCYGRDLVREDFKYTWPLAQPASLWVRERILQVGGIDAKLHLGMDLDLFIRLLNGKHYLAFEPGVVAGIRVQPNSKSVKYRVATAQNALRIVKKHFGESVSPMESDYHRELRDALNEQAPNAALQMVTKSWAVVRPLSWQIYRLPLLTWLPRVGTRIKSTLLKLQAWWDGWRFAWSQRRNS